MLKIRPIQKYEISSLQGFPPEDWNLDLPKLFSFHFGYEYFYPIVAEVNNIIVGCGISITHRHVSWLGTIIVLPEYRRQGIGKELTTHLMEYCRGKGCTTQLLTASEMGEPIYRKLGFVTSETYIFYKRESIIPSENISNVREARSTDRKLIQELDKEITGEERFVFLERFLPTAWVSPSETSAVLNGVYLPDFGNGLILAKNSEHGFALMKLRLKHGKTTAIIPSANTAAREYITSLGFHEYRTAPRMVLGKDVQWKSDMVYNRGTGYCG
jgi:GNAT superfamily N-acetyltransferase